jgi:hypothetical protein
MPKNFTSIAVGLLALTAVLGTVACGPAESNEPAATGDCKNIPKVRVESESCCPDYGADACGADLFCAAFDGREIATCYREYSRLGLEECTDDVQCMTQSCNQETKKCRSETSDTCEAATGCADGRYRCANACLFENVVCSTAADCDYYTTDSCSGGSRCVQ